MKGCLLSLLLLFTYTQVDSAEHLSDYTEEKVEKSVAGLADDKCDKDAKCTLRWKTFSEILRTNGVNGVLLESADADDLADLKGDQGEHIPRIWAKKIVEHFADLEEEYSGHPFLDPDIQPDEEYVEQAEIWKRYNEGFAIGNENGMVPNVEIAVAIMSLVIVLLLMQGCMADWYDDFFNRNNFTWLMLTVLSIFILRFGLTFVHCMVCVGVWAFLVSLNYLRHWRKNRGSAGKAQNTYKDLEAEDESPGCLECDMCANKNAVDRENLKSFVKRHQPEQIEKLTQSIVELHEQFRDEAQDSTHMDAASFRDTIKAVTQYSHLHGAKGKRKKKGPKWLQNLKGVVKEDMHLFQYLAEDRSYDKFFDDPTDEAVKTMLRVYPGNDNQYTNFTLGPSSYLVLMTTMKGTLFKSLIPIILCMCLYMVVLQWLYQRYCFENAVCIYKFEAVTANLETWHDYVFWLMAFSILDGSSSMIEKWHDIQDCCWDIRKEIMNNATMYGQACGNDHKDRRYRFYRYLQVFHFYAYVTPTTIISEGSRPPLIHALLPMINNIFKNNGLLDDKEFAILEEHDPTERWQILISWITDMYKQLEYEDSYPSPNYDLNYLHMRETTNNLHEKLQYIRPFSHMQLLEYIIYAYLISLPVTSTYNMLAAGPTIIDYQVVDYIFAIVIGMFTQGLMKFQILADQPFKYAQTDTFKPISLMRDTEAACLLFLRRPWGEQMGNLRWEVDSDGEPVEEDGSEDEGSKSASSEPKKGRAAEPQETWSTRTKEGPPKTKQINVPRAYHESKKNKTPTTTGWFQGH